MKLTYIKDWNGQKYISVKDLRIFFLDTARQHRAAQHKNDHNRITAEAYEHLYEEFSKYDT